MNKLLLTVAAALLFPAVALAGVPIQGGGSAVTAEVETNSRALRVTARPIDPAMGGARGCYAYSATSGVLAAALAANAVVFSARYDPATTTDIAIVTHLKVAFLPLTLFTAATLTDATSFDAFIGRSFSVAHTGGTAGTLTGDNLKLRTSFASTSFADIRISTTAALGGGTVTLPTHPFAQTLRKANRTNPAAATEETITDATAGNIEVNFNVGDSEYPIALADQEGIVVRNRTVWPAAGTGQIQVTMRWCEVTSY